MESVKKCSVEELRNYIEGGSAAVVDVREYPEWAHCHVEGALLIPLSVLRRDPLRAAKSGEIFLLCRTGKRAEEAARFLRRDGHVKPVVVEGGIQAWELAGYPVGQVKGPISLERQMRISAGALILTGVLVPKLKFIHYLVGAGLIFAGITNTSGLASLLALLPWNRPRHPAEHAVARSNGNHKTL